MYKVMLIDQDNQMAFLPCATLEEAEEVKRSFENCGKYKHVSICSFKSLKENIA